MSTEDFLPAPIQGDVAQVHGAQESAASEVLVKEREGDGE